MHGFNQKSWHYVKATCSQGIYDECRRDFLIDIQDKVKSCSIPADFVLNEDQTPSSYISVGKLTMAARGAKSVPIKGLTDK